MMNEHILQMGTDNRYQDTYSKNHSWSGTLTEVNGKEVVYLSKKG